MLVIREMTAIGPENLSDLTEIVVGVVKAGASIGWTDPPGEDEARAYWRSTLRTDNILLCAFDGERIVGTGQLELAQRANGRHRAEVNKVLVHPNMQGRGVGSRVMAEVEATAIRVGRTLLHLDTNEDDTTNIFYQRLGWIPIGTIPNWARSGPDRTLHGTTFYYKNLASR